jgi:hypothetical protein
MAVSNQKLLSQLLNTYKMRTKQLKLKLTVPLLLTVMILCMGCPYESKYPLEGNRVRYDKNMIGTWHDGDVDLKITRIDDYRFSYVYNDHDEDYGAGEESGTGYAVTNNGATYLVVQRDSYDRNVYAIYKVLSVESDGLNVIPLEETDISSSKKFYSAQDFTSYVINNSGSSFAYANRYEMKRGASTYTSYDNNRNNNNYNNQSSSGNVLFKEDFQTFDNNWYSNYNFKDSNYIYIATLDNPSNHYYLFRNRKYKNGFIVPVPYKSIPRSGYSIEINAKHYDGVEDAGYGLKFGASGWTNCYNFNISANGYYRISKRQNDVYSDIVPWTSTSAVNTGSATNKLEVRVYSTYTEFYINGQYMRRLDITPFGSTAGLEVYNNQTVYYDDLVIKSLSGSSNNSYSNSNNNYSSDVLFREDYQTHDNNWYSNYNFKDSNYIYIATLDNPSNHYYLFRNRKEKGGYFVPIPFYSIPSSYYSIEINAKHFDGKDDSGYGLKFGASDWDNTYNFDITANGYYRVSKSEYGTYSEIVPWTKTSILYQGSSTNKLEVRVYITYADMYINGQYVTRINNFSKFGNNAGLEVYNNQTIYFDDLVIRKL